MASSETPEPSYTVFIRLPFPREDFVDPPPVEWDALKDKSLWKILSKASKNSDVDWAALATKFDVSLPFLLQQAAWLYERQFSQVRAQLRKVGAKSSASPVPTDSTGGEAMRRTGSGGGVPRAPSSLSIRRDSPRPDTSTSQTPSRSMAPPLSRTSSASTAIQSRNLPPTSPRPAKAILTLHSTPPPPKPRPALNIAQQSRPNPLSPSEPADSTSSESSSDSDLPAQSRLLRRPPRFGSNKLKQLGQSQDADDEDAPPFLPFSTSPESNTHHDPSATIRGDPNQISRRAQGKKATEIGQQSQTSDSSASSTAATPLPGRKGMVHGHRPTGPLSPRRPAEVGGRSPLERAKGLGREGSEGSPSMGSSFSDLDDASVTQSALEEALASNMQHGGVASRMSTISQALRSRYL